MFGTVRSHRAASGRNIRNRSVLLAAGAVLMGWAGGASAAPSDKVLATFSRLDVALTGHVSARCELGGGANISLGELAGNAGASARLPLGCNVPFDLTFKSARGGLAHITQPGGEGPYAGTLGYTLNVRVPLIDPTPSTMRGMFESRELLNSRTLSSGEAVAAGDAQLEIRTLPTVGAGLLAGRYSETLTVTVSPRV